MQLGNLKRIQISLINMTVFRKITFSDHYLRYASDATNNRLNRK